MSNYFGNTVNKKSPSGESGFSLVEAVIALVVFLILVLGIFAVLIYAVNYNMANNTRSKALAVLQQEAENLRTAKFSSTTIDAGLLGGIKTPKTVITDQGERFLVEVIVDDDPFSNGVQVDNGRTLKEIDLTVTPINPTPGWQTAIPAALVIRRVRAN
jgi:type II secretory pathway pseudopilin PulG